MSPSEPSSITQQQALKLLELRARLSAVERMIALSPKRSIRPTIYCAQALHDLVAFASALPASFAGRRQSQS